MVRSALLATMILLSVSVGATASDGSRAQRDQAFLNDLAQTADRAPAQLCLATAKGSQVIARSCVGAFCLHDADCASCPGGLSAWYCSSLHRCTPF